MPIFPPSLYSLKEINNLGASVKQQTKRYWSENVCKCRFHGNDKNMSSIIYIKIFYGLQRGDERHREMD